MRFDGGRKNDPGATTSIHENGSSNLRDFLWCCVRGPFLIAVVVLPPFLPHRHYHISLEDLASVLEVVAHVLIVLLGCLLWYHDVSKYLVGRLRAYVSDKANRVVLEEFLFQDGTNGSSLWSKWCLSLGLSCFASCGAFAASSWSLLLPEDAEERLQLVQYALQLDSREQAQQLLLQPGGFKLLLPAALTKWLENNEEDEVNRNNSPCMGATTDAGSVVGYVMTTEEEDDDDDDDDGRDDSDDFVAVLTHNDAEVEDETHHLTLRPPHIVYPESCAPQTLDDDAVAPQAAGSAPVISDDETQKVMMIPHTPDTDGGSSSSSSTGSSNSSSAASWNMEERPSFNHAKALDSLFEKQPQPLQPHREFSTLSFSSSCSTVPTSNVARSSCATNPSLHKETVTTRRPPPSKPTATAPTISAENLSTSRKRAFATAAAVNQSSPLRPPPPLTLTSIVSNKLQRGLLQHVEAFMDPQNDETWKNAKLACSISLAVLLLQVSTSRRARQIIWTAVQASTTLTALAVATSTLAALLARHEFLQQMQQQEQQQPNSSQTNNDSDVMTRIGLALRPKTVALLLQECFETLRDKIAGSPSEFGISQALVVRKDRFLTVLLRSKTKLSNAIQNAFQEGTEFKRKIKGVAAALVMSYFCHRQRRRQKQLHKEASTPHSRSHVSTETINDTTAGSSWEREKRDLNAL